MFFFCLFVCLSCKERDGGGGVYKDNSLRKKLAEEKKERKIQAEKKCSVFQGIWSVRGRRVGFARRAVTNNKSQVMHIHTHKMVSYTYAYS